MMRQYELVDRVRKYNPHADEDLLNRAYVYAMKAHGAQKRASGDPFFSHPLEVAAILTDLKLDEATIVAAVLHDVIEDTASTREEIDALFGKEIGSLVDGLTKLKKLDLVSKRAQQAENFRKLLLAIADDARVLLVKLADRLHNMRTLKYMPPDKRMRIAEETLDIYGPLAGRMGMQGLRDELDDLAFRQLMPEAHAMIVARLQELKIRNGPRDSLRGETSITAVFAAAVAPLVPIRPLSTKTTDAPLSAAESAAQAPAGPPPRTRTSVESRTTFSSLSVTTEPGRELSRLPREHRARAWRRRRSFAKAHSRLQKNTYDRLC
jgi:hypothetical protein